jgi:hypothetical protein
MIESIVDHKLLLTVIGAELFFVISKSETIAIYTLLGIASYGFPFTAIRRIITQSALSILERSLEVSQRTSKTNDRLADKNSMEDK